jgi:disulfide bond formation protein DsbB
MATRSIRPGFALGAASCALLLGYGFYLQYHDGQNPCPLCLVQRGFYFGLLFVFLAAAIHGPRRTATMVYGVLGLLLATAGAATAGRQVWLQHLPADKVPKCGPDLYYMLDNFPIAKTITNLFRGSGECAEVTWRFLGLSIAEWSLAWFLAFGVLSVWALFRRAN